MNSLLSRQDDVKLFLACIIIQIVEIKLVAGNFVNILVYIIITLFALGINKYEFFTFGVPCELLLIATPIIPAGIVGIEADSNCIRLVLIAEPQPILCKCNRFI